MKLNETVLYYCHFCCKWFDTGSVCLQPHRDTTEAVIVGSDRYYDLICVPTS